MAKNQPKDPWEAESKKKAEGIDNNLCFHMVFWTITGPEKFITKCQC